MHVKIMKSMRSDYAGMILPGRPEKCDDNEKYAATVEVDMILPGRTESVKIMKSMRVCGRGGYDRRGAPYEW